MNILLRLKIICFSIILSSCSGDINQVSYLEQSSMQDAYETFSTRYVNQFQLLNQISGTKLREDRKKVFSKFSPYFKDWEVKFANATTSGNSANVVFFDSKHSSLFYKAKIDSSDPAYGTLANLSFGSTVFISGLLQTSSFGNDYFVEDSFTEVGSMLAPEFNVNISSVRLSKRIKNVGDAGKTKALFNLVGEPSYALFKNKNHHAFIEARIGNDNLTGVMKYFQNGTPVKRIGDFIFGFGCASGQCNYASGFWFAQISTDYFVLVTLDVNDNEITIKQYSTGSDVLKVTPNSAKIIHDAPLEFKNWLVEYGVL